MTVRRPRIDDLTDDALMCFVRWCRLNDERIVSLPELCRGVLVAYANATKPKRTKRAPDE